jgi:hypothetical protein
MYEDVGFGDYGADFGADAQATTVPAPTSASPWGDLFRGLVKQTADTGLEAAKSKLIKKQPETVRERAVEAVKSIDPKWLVVGAVGIALVVGLIVAKQRSQRYAR